MQVICELPVPARIEGFVLPLIVIKGFHRFGGNRNSFGSDDSDADILFSDEKARARARNKSQVKVIFPIEGKRDAAEIENFHRKFVERD